MLLLIDFTRDTVPSTASELFSLVSPLTTAARARPSPAVNECRCGRRHPAPRRTDLALTGPVLGEASPRCLASEAAGEASSLLQGQANQRVAQALFVVRLLADRRGSDHAIVVKVLVGHQGVRVSGDVVGHEHVYCDAQCLDR